MRGWATLQCTRKDVDAAGAALTAESSAQIDLEAVLGVIDNWRACHAFPLNTFQMYLRSKTKQVDKQGIVAQRIKRLRAIELKLRLMPRLRLSQMQDIGGCRAVVRSVGAVVALHGLYRESQIKHRYLHHDDYIQTPRASGYRGVHLIYRYYSDKNPAYNGLKIEMQLRTRLQHAWATAVETVGAFKDQPLKSGLGDEQWLRFFALMGSILAMR
jgi:(p)ppGpp synthase/HD superfamily hydrolase